MDRVGRLSENGLTKSGLNDCIMETILHHDRPVLASEIVKHIKETRNVDVAPQRISMHVATQPSRTHLFKRIPKKASLDRGERYRYDTLKPRPKKNNYPPPTPELNKIHKILNKGLPLKRHHVLSKIFKYLKECKIFCVRDTLEIIGTKIGRGYKTIYRLEALGLLRLSAPPYTLPPDFETWSPTKRNQYVIDHNLPRQFRSIKHFTYDPSKAVTKIMEHYDQKIGALIEERKTLIRYLNE